MMGDNSLILPYAELVHYGCRNCVWRLHGQCPHGISAGEVYEFLDSSSSVSANQSSLLPEKDGVLDEAPSSVSHPSGHVPGAVKISGYCPELVDFILSLSDDTASLSSIWEKYALYVTKLQSMVDYRSYLQLESIVNRLEHQSGYVTGHACRDGQDGQDYRDGQDFERLRYLQEKKVMLKMLWMKLNEQVIRGFGKIVDREQKEKGSTQKLPGILSAKTINFNLTRQLDSDDTPVESIGNQSGITDKSPVAEKTKQVAK